MVPICLVTEEALKRLPDDVRQYLRALRRRLIALEQTDAQQRIAELEAANRALQTQVQDLLGLVQRQQQQIQELQRQLADALARLGANSSNSSRPPSSDGPHVKRRPPGPPSGRPSGGQHGHPRQQRPLREPTQTRPCKPGSCRRCGRPLAGADPTPLRYQVLELPEIRPEVIEYQLHRLACPGCGITTCAPLPGGAPRGGQGPRLQALLAVLTGAYRLSKRQVEQLLADVFALPVSAAQVCDLEGQTAELLGPVVAELTEHVRTQPANVDETGWREGTAKAWLWVAVTARATVYRVAAGRSAAERVALLGRGYDQVLTSDRFGAYSGVAVRLRQVCWAHLRRDFQAMVDRGGAGAPIGAELLFNAELLFGLWYRVRDGTRSRRWLRGQIDGWLGPEVRGLLEEGACCGCARTEGTCREILKVFEALWTFARVPGVEPTNNAAERALRHAVLWRRVSHGSASPGGGRFVASILTVVETCRQQGRKVLDFLTACCEAALAKLRPPSLLPQANA